MKALSLSLLLSLCYVSLSASESENEVPFSKKIVLKSDGSSSYISLEEGLSELSIRIFSPSGSLVFSKAVSEPLGKDTKIAVEEDGDYWVVFSLHGEITKMKLRTNKGLEEA